MQMIKVRYPSAKVVCIIGDWISAGMQKTIQKVADHYGARTVDFLSVNGFKDTEYMTKYNGPHPDAGGMAFMADLMACWDVCAWCACGTTCGG